MVILATNCGFAYVIEEMLDVAIENLITIHERILKAVIVGKQVWLVLLLSKDFDLDVLS